MLLTTTDDRLTYWIKRSFGDRASPEAARFAEAFDLAPTPARVLAEIYEAGAGAIGGKEIAARVRIGGQQVINTVCALRARLGGGFIQSRTHGGYRLSPEGMAACRAALREPKAA